MIFFVFVLKKKLLCFEQKIKLSWIEVPTRQDGKAKDLFIISRLAHDASNIKSGLFPFYYHFADCQICCDYVFKIFYINIHRTFNIA